MPSAYEGTDIIMSEANNKVLPIRQVLISYRKAIYLHFTRYSVYAIPAKLQNQVK